MPKFSIHNNNLENENNFAQITARVNRDLKCPKQELFKFYFIQRAPAHLRPQLREHVYLDVKKFERYAKILLDNDNYPRTDTLEGGDEQILHRTKIDQSPTDSSFYPSSECDKFSYLQLPPDTPAQTDSYSRSDNSFRDNDFRPMTARGLRAFDADPTHSSRIYGGTMPTENNGRHTPPTIWASPIYVTERTTSPPASTYVFPELPKPPPELPKPPPELPKPPPELPKPPPELPTPPPELPVIVNSEAGEVDHVPCSLPTQTLPADKFLPALIELPTKLPEEPPIMGTAMSPLTSATSFADTPAPFADRNVKIPAHGGTLPAGNWNNSNTLPIEWDTNTVVTSTNNTTVKSNLNLCGGILAETTPHLPLSHHALDPWPPPSLLRPPPEPPPGPHKIPSGVPQNHRRLNIGSNPISASSFRQQRNFLIASTRPRALGPTKIPSGVHQNHRRLNIGSNPISASSFRQQRTLLDASELASPSFLRPPPEPPP